jgi:hypothetical protein
MNVPPSIGEKPVEKEEKVAIASKCWWKRDVCEPALFEILPESATFGESEGRSDSNISGFEKLGLVSRVVLYGLSALERIPGTHHQSVAAARSEMFVELGVGLLIKAIRKYENGLCAFALYNATHPLNSLELDSSSSDQVEHRMATQMEPVCEPMKKSRLPTCRWAGEQYRAP